MHRRPHPRVHWRAVRRRRVELGEGIERLAGRSSKLVLRTLSSRSEMGFFDWEEEDVVVVVVVGVLW